MLKFLIVIGTRPEAIKLTPLVRTLVLHAAEATVRVCVTAQHRELLDQALVRAGLRADHDLDIMTLDQTPAGVAAAVMGGMQDVLRVEKPDWVVVQGDTTTTVSAALAAAYGGFKVAHVEAGLRTHDNRQPFPEEMNRCLVTRVADVHFAPTPSARDNLLREGVGGTSIFVTGNTGIDALLATLAEQDGGSAAVSLPGLPPRARMVLATAHRRENLGEPLRRICAALRDVAALDKYTHVVYPLHPRPEVREIGHDLLDGAPRVVLCDPPDHAGLVRLMARSDLVITDSGGLQEEAPTLGKPVVVLREVTERPEAVDVGAARLAGTDRDRIVAAAVHYLDGGAQVALGEAARQCYGDGRAAERIAAILLGKRAQEWVPQVPRVSN